MLLRQRSIYRKLKRRDKDINPYISTRTAGFLIHEIPLGYSAKYPESDADAI